MRIDIWSDVICPYCWIGKRHLESALADFRGKNPGAEVEVVWRAFELDPDAPVQATETTPQMLSRKYGVPLERAEAMQRQMAATFEGLGPQFTGGKRRCATALTRTASLRWPVRGGLPTPWTRP